jgi:hypothetical protein
MPAASGGQRFSTIQAWAVDDDRLSLSGLRMLVLLGTYSDPKGWSWPSQDELAGRLGGISRQAVSKCIKELETLCYIEVHYYGGNHGFAKRARYKLIMDQPIPDRFNRRVQWQAQKEHEEADGPVNSPVDSEPMSTDEFTGTQPRGLQVSNPSVEIKNVPNRTNPKNDPNNKRASGAPVVKASQEPLEPRSAEEQEIIDIIAEIKGFPTNQRDFTTKRLREYREEFPDVDFKLLARKIRDSGRRVGNGWLTVRTWAENARKFKAEDAAREQRGKREEVIDLAEYRRGTERHGAAAADTEHDPAEIARLNELINTLPGVPRRPLAGAAE